MTTILHLVQEPGERPFTDCVILHWQRHFIYRQ